MAATKALLKSIKSAIDSNDFTLAEAKAADLVARDAKNYTALIFLGFARQKLDQNEKSEKAYEQAIELKPNEPQALKGLIALYEPQEQKALDKYHATAIRLAEGFCSTEDRKQCQDVIAKYVTFAMKHGTKSQIRHALELHLPSCSFYPCLEGSIPQPQHTIMRLIESMETEEREWTNTQIGERRTRLGVTVDQTVLEVKREAYVRYPLQNLYQEMISWTQEDDVRRSCEEKLLHREYEILMVLPDNEKASKSSQVLNLANGMVIIKHQYELAWMIALEWVDDESLGEWDPNVLREFIEFFPNTGLAKVFRGYMASESAPFPKATIVGDNSDSPEDDDPELSEADRLLMMVEGLDESPDSLLAHRIMAEVYLLLGEYQSAVEVSQKAQKLCLRTSQKCGIGLQNSIDAVNITLANAFISYQSPRYHQDAKLLFEYILSRKPTLTVALSGIGEVLKEDGEFEAAVSFFEQALEKDPGNLKVKADHAWCRALSGDMLAAGLSELKDTLHLIIQHKPENSTLKAEVLYRIGTCQWQLDNPQYPRDKRSGPYKFFIDSAKANPSYAPAYTALGIFFEEYGKSLPRARTAFQKAFELSANEVEAARRLARIFADNGEWDLVELVASRVIECGMATPAPGSKRKALSWPFASLGVVDMNKQQYSTGVIHFQKALRIEPDHYNSWVGLGESYHNSGRYIAAERALRQANSVEGDLGSKQKWFAAFMLANVQREIGAFDEAISGYETVLQLREGDVGVGIALLQTLVDSAWASFAAGKFGDAAQRAGRALEIADQIFQPPIDSFSLWKAVGDACAVLSACPGHSDDSHFELLRQILDPQRSGDGPKSGSPHVPTKVSPSKDALSNTKAMDKLNELDGLDLSTLEIATDGNTDNKPSDEWRYLIHGITASKRAILAAAHNSHAQAVSWYNLGWMEYHLSAPTSPSQQNNETPFRAKSSTAAIKSFKRAIELESSNPDFWNAFGVSTMSAHPGLAQHAFVRSLHLNDKSARTWTNLGTLYLIQGEMGLANQAFTRAQSTDPDFAGAWVGQGVLAGMMGEKGESLGLFTHAFGISAADEIMVKKEYVAASFDQLIVETYGKRVGLESLVQPLFALRQLHAQTPNDVATRHLLALYSERIGSFEEAEEHLKDVCGAVEEEYERSESTNDLSRFSQAKADLARAQLARGKYASAYDNAEMALDLSSEDAATETDGRARNKWRLSAHLTAGLASFFLGEMDRAFDLFQEALKESSHEPDVVCMLAQVLWAKGGAEERTVAREQLLDCVEKHPDHVGAVTLLGVIALLDQDEDAIEAVEGDLRAMQLDDKLSGIDRAKVNRVLLGVSEFLTSKSPNGNKEEAALLEATRAVMMAPTQSRGWSELAAVSSNEYAAEMALTNATRNIPPRGDVDAMELSAAFVQTGRRRDVLQAIMLTPWKADGWNTLADSV